MRTLEKIAKLIGTLDNKYTNEIVGIVKNHRKKLAHAAKLNLRIGMEVWFGCHNGNIEKINHTRVIVREFGLGGDSKKWTVPINMVEVA